MTDTNGFKLILRAIGVLLIGLAIPSIFEVIGSFTLNQNGFYGVGGWHAWLWPVSYAAGALLQVVFAIYLLCGAPRLTRYCIKQVHTRCASCDYDIRGLSGPCPECGLIIPASNIAGSFSNSESSSSTQA